MARLVFVQDWDEFVDDSGLRHDCRGHWETDCGEQPDDDDPVCVCGVHRSEHQLCGCEEWEQAA